jgi:hypothetical protein
VRIKINNAADADAQFVMFDAPIAAKDTLLLTFGATLGAGDVVVVYSSNADTAFQLFGSEIAWWRCEVCRFRRWGWMGVPGLFSSSLKKHRSRLSIWLLLAAAVVALHLAAVGARVVTVATFPVKTLAVVFLLKPLLMQS